VVNHHALAKRRFVLSDAAAARYNDAAGLVAAHDGPEGVFAGAIRRQVRAAHA